ncbi:hypothetical protein LAZ67_X000892 [Cordylochernes scorpioides]|uniref:Uncharacterized protein n=1 Tax=Cordylochernes scorpioides TaxID=51811 RepID=A0ABY6LSF8_9ARAC|nr:hypothetical protein LAZ67_X000892 [Cordylochernes scorpioides]
MVILALHFRTVDESHIIEDIQVFKGPEEWRGDCPFLGQTCLGGAQNQAFQAQHQELKESLGLKFKCLEDEISSVKEEMKD